MSEQPATVDALHAAIIVEQKQLLDAAMKKLANCLRQLGDEQLWWRPAASQNSIANLILHVCGNLTQWVICGVGELPDTRDRGAEFAAEGGPGVAELNEQLAATIQAVKSTLDAVTAEQLLASRRVQGFEVSGLGAIVHSITHFVGHTHQIIQLTRLQLGDGYAFEWTPAADDQDLPI